MRKLQNTVAVSGVSSLAQLLCDDNMFVFCKVAAVTLVAVLTLCDQVHTAEIIGGHPVQKHSRPYMVLLEYQIAEGHTKHCGGFLVSKDFVLTAAHCQAKSYKVFVGLHSYYSRNGVQQLSVEKHFPHQNYNKCSYVNDIMLLKLSSSANFTKNVRNIALADDNNFLPNSCNVSGWGQTKKNGTMSLDLMEVNVKLIENQICVRRRAYCSGDTAGPSNGDSGGPLVCEDGKAHGVVSLEYKAKNGNSKPVFMYTKIVGNRRWIDSILKNN
uniref:trypsin n=3 Tax=Salarias fasciatus TaxID=181472 RepID=A0A672HRU3_SALFA